MVEIQEVQLDKDGIEPANALDTVKLLSISISESVHYTLSMPSFLLKSEFLSSFQIQADHKKL
jgi:hypothetical protein